MDWPDLEAIHIMVNPMIYAALAFLMFVCAAMGGMLYAKGRDSAHVAASLQMVLRNHEAQSAEIKELWEEISKLAIQSANAGAANELASRVVNLERKQTDDNAPRVVRGINQGRRMAAQMGGVEKLG